MLKIRQLVSSSLRFKVRQFNPVVEKGTEAEEGTSVKRKCCLLWGWL